MKRELVVYQNNDEKQNGYKEAVLAILDKWIEHNDKSEELYYKDALTLCRDIIKVFDADCEFYADDVQWDTIREYVREYESANECKFEW